MPAAAQFSTRFATGKRKLSRSTFDAIGEVARNTPGDMQELCDAIWDCTRNGQTISEADVRKGLDVIFSRERDHYEIFIRRLTALQMRVLTAMASKGGQEVFSVEFLSAASVLNAASVKRAIDRLVQGHADYTPMVFEKKELNGYTWARELAQGIVFSAPFLCFGDYPKNYLENPAVAIIRALPSVYDETRILPASEIGRCIAVAKRKGADWFVAVENGAEARPIEIALDFLSRGDYDVLSFGDAEDRPDGYAVGRGLKTCSDSFLLALKPCGGFAAWLRRR